MGHTGTMKSFLAIAVIALAVTCSFGENSDGEAAFMQAAAKGIKHAEGTLLGMKPVEQREIKDMKKIETDLSTLGPESIVDVERMANTAVQGEDKPQGIALKTRDQLRSIIKSFADAGLHKMLGESNDPMKSAAKKALNKLKDVEQTLTRETSTFHAKHKLQKMAKEAKAMENSQTELGENP